LIGLHLLVLDDSADVMLHALEFFFVFDVKQSLLQPSRVLFEITQFFILGHCWGIGSDGSDCLTRFHRLTSSAGCEPLKCRAAQASASSD
jgi:hypothetical protein